MAERNRTNYDDMFARMKARYDGYHFSSKMQDIYNPFSLFNALNSGELADYWFDRGTSGALIIVEKDPEYANDEELKFFQVDQKTKRFSVRCVQD
jgi:hypothetical protein